MDRLVYSPSIKAWVKTDTGVVDLSPYITECKIERKINEISKLEVVFRNPKAIQRGAPRFLFTEGTSGNGNIGPVFQPMDPITVVLQRLADRPIQVFTGYCDTVPYVQLFPGLARITASCTLKRLEYTYWDPGLKFVSDFMKEYGWLLGTDGVVRAGGSNQVNKADDLRKTSLNDSSIGHLLYAVLNEIGGWNDKNIYIQPLPSNIGAITVKLFDQINKDNKQVNEEITRFLRDIIGNGEFGSLLSSGGGGGGSGSGVTMVGDSITYLSKAEIEKAMPGIVVYSEGAKHLFWSTPDNPYNTSDPGGDSGLKILKDNESTLGHVVVVALGTNDTGTTTAQFGKAIDKAMGHIGSTRKAVFVTVTNSDAINSAIQESKSRYSNIYIADWKARAELQPGDVHPTEHGKKVFADVIAKVVNPLVPKENANLPTGTKSFQGRPVAAWIVPILEWAKQNGWDGTITSGFRTYEKQAELHAQNPDAAAPGTSRHEFTEYPKGAIDVGGMGLSAKPAGQALNDVLKRYPGSPKLVWGGPIIGDWGHFSSDGH